MQSHTNFVIRCIGNQTFNFCNVYAALYSFSLLQSLRLLVFLPFRNLKLLVAVAFIASVSIMLQYRF